MRFDDQQVDVGGVDDRRGRRGGGGAVALGGGGLGVVGLVIYLAVQLLGGGGGSGVDLSGLGAAGSGTGTGTGETIEQVSDRCNADGGIERYDDCFLIKTYNEINEVWAEEVGADYREPRLGFFTDNVSTGCGEASSQVGPFYCPPDEELYIDLGFLEQLQQRFGAEGRYAQSYIVAHEVGHHLQTLFGTERAMRTAQQASPDRANELSVGLELQADCYAGVWGKLADDAGNFTITEAELTQALDAAAAVGDDRIQEASGGRVDPESWTHGSAEERRASYQRGFTSGDLQQCPDPA